jgi:TonB family protein
MTGSQNALKLRITGPDGSTTESRSEGESVIIGSGAGAGLRLSDPDVSSLHLLLKLESGGGVTAIDLGSARGTRFKDQQVRAPLPLSSGDVLELGGTRLQVLFGQDEDRLRGPAKPFSIRGGAALLFSQALPPHEKPTDENKVLQVAMLWGDTVIDVQHFGDGAPVTIGEKEGNCFQVFSAAIGDSFPLAVAHGSSVTAAVPSTAAPSGETLVGGLHDRLHIPLENVSFILRFVRRQPGVKVRVLEDTDIGFLKIAALCAMAFIALIADFLINGQPAPRVDRGALQPPAQFAKLLIRLEEKRKQPSKKVSGVREGAKAMDEEGKFGLKNAKKEEADPSRPGSPIVDPNKREDDRKKVMTAGLLGAWGKSPDASNILGPGGLGIGINNALGGLKAGAGLTDARGIGGLGSRGSGSGGGGTALGLGGLGTRGDGRGVGGSGAIELSGHGKDTTRVVPGKTIVVGGLSKEVIAKIIRSHQSEIKYCYEIELQKKPSLFGKVAVLFTINASGSVSDANVSESSLDNSNTEQCMLARIRRWKFPEPQGGGLVTVNFPWIFKPAGGEES